MPTTPSGMTGAIRLYHQPGRALRSRRMGALRHEPVPVGREGTASLSPYFFGGLGLGLCQCEAGFRNDNQEKALQDLNRQFQNTDHTAKNLGLKANINKLWLLLELDNMRYPFTDYLMASAKPATPIRMTGTSLEEPPDVSDQVVFS